MPRRLSRERLLSQLCAKHRSVAVFHNQTERIKESIKMSKEFIILLILAAIVVFVGDFISKRIGDKATRKADERANRKRAQQDPRKTEHLADRYKGSEKL
jgi:Na+-transporting methylmalonyl-CoA/oxaloacetate decarboxylase gamma subunit